MNCPVCEKSGIPDERKNCPQCNADLEIFQMTRKLDQTSKNRLGYGVFASVLFAILLIAWIFTGFVGQSADTENVQTSQLENARLKTEIQKMKTDLKKMKAEKKILAKENVSLTQKVAEIQKEQEKRVKEYTVKNGETLFGIARKVYGSGFRYVDLARENNLDDPTSIKAGQTLIIYY